MTNKTYNGHKNWNHWNVSLWLNNDEGLYREALRWIRITKDKDLAARHMLQSLHGSDIYQTPDGAPYSFSSIRAAMRDMSL